MNSSNGGPVFIGGLAHSGKTPLRMMLSAHPNLSLTRRTYMWTRYYDRFGDLGQSDNYERCLTAMLAQKSIQEIQPDRARIEREFLQGPPTYGRLFGLFHQHYAERVGKPRWGDQLGFVERHADAIFASYPTAKMIHMIRDPRHRNAISATRSRNRPGKMGWETARWLDSAALADRNMQRYPNGYKLVRYESLVSAPEETLHQICEFLGEDFSPAMLSPGEASAKNGSADGASIDSHEIWLGFDLKEAATVSTPTAEGTKPPPISDRDSAVTQTYAKRDIAALGYPIAPTQLSSRDQLLFRLVDLPVNWAGMVAWRTLNGKQSS